MAARRGQVEMRIRGVAVATAVVVHALLLVILVQGFRTWPYLAERPAMTVQLATPQTRPRSPKSPRRREREASQAPATPHPERSAPDNHATVEAPPPADGFSGGSRQALRDLLGCEHAAFLGLSSEERRRCQDKAMANARDAEQLRLDLDPHGLYVVNPTPYLNRKPRNGCKVMAGGDAGPAGQAGAAVGIGCGKTF